MFLHMLARATQWVLLFVTAACAATAPASSGLIVTTDAAAYSLGPGGSAMVHATAANRSSTPFFLAECGPGAAWLVQTQGSNGVWSPSAPELCLNQGETGITGGPVAGYRLDPDSTIVETLTFDSAQTFRVTLDYATDSGGTPNREGASNAFVVTAPQ